MTYEKFIEKVKSCPVSWITEDRYHNSESRYSKNKKKYDDKIPFAIHSYGETGGVSGGSCWDSSDPQSYSNPHGCQESINEINKCLALILTEVCPNISFLTYSIIYNELIESKETSNYEYYGNSTDYINHYIILKNLYDRLVENHVINDLPDNVDSLTIE